MGCLRKCLAGGSPIHGVVVGENAGAERWQTRSIETSCDSLTHIHCNRDRSRTLKETLNKGRKGDINVPFKIIACG